MTQIADLIAGQSIEGLNALVTNKSLATTKTGKRYCRLTVHQVVDHLLGARPVRTHDIDGLIGTAVHVDNRLRLPGERQALLFRARVDGFVYLAVWVFLL